jgi:hypothetical protein
VPERQILDPRLPHVMRLAAHQHAAARARMLIGLLHHHQPAHTSGINVHDRTRNPGRSNNNDVASLIGWPPA